MNMDGLMLFGWIFGVCMSVILITATALIVQAAFF